MSEEFQRFWMVKFCRPTSNWHTKHLKKQLKKKISKRIGAKMWPIVWNKTFLLNALSLLFTSTENPSPLSYETVYCLQSAGFLKFILLQDFPTKRGWYCTYTRIFRSNIFSYSIAIYVILVIFYKVNNSPLQYFTYSKATNAILSVLTPGTIRFNIQPNWKYEVATHFGRLSTSYHCTSSKQRRTAVKAAEQKWHFGNQPPWYHAGRETSHSTTSTFGCS